MWSIACTISAILWRPITKSLGGRLYYKFITVTRVTVSCIIPVHLYGIESVPSVRPPSPCLAWGTLPGLCLGLGGAEK